MAKHQKNQLSLQKKTLFTFAGNGNSRNSETTERTTVTITISTVAILKK